MDIPATLILITILILVVAYVIRPFLALQAGGLEKSAGHQPASALRQRADLLAGRNRVYHALHDLDFDHQTNKIADDEYAAQRRALVAEGVGILEKLDELGALDAAPQAEPLKAPARQQGKSPSAPAKKSALLCPQCGTKIKRSDVFCGRCGASLGGK